MIGLDTNVIVRYLTADDAAQLRAVDRLVARAIDQEELLAISHGVLAETVWVLEAAYGYPKADLLTALDAILETRQFFIEDKDSVRAAIEDYRAGKGDFSDYLFARHYGRLGCDTMATFDRSLRGALFTKL